MEIELREYVIRDGQMDAWVDGWRSGVVPLRQREGFEIMGAWVDRAGSRFIWLLGYTGEGTFDTADDRYYSSRHGALDVLTGQVGQAADGC